MNTLGRPDDHEVPEDEPNVEKELTYDEEKKNIDGLIKEFNKLGGERDEMKASLRESYGKVDVDEFIRKVLEL